MNKIFYITVLISLLMGATILTSFATSEQGSHHPAGAQAAATSSSNGMMMQQGMGMNQRPCMAATPSGSNSQMMGMMGMMGGGMGDMMGGGGMHGMMPMFYLDRADELKLSPEQVNQLKAIQVECRKDNIRNAAETKIAQLELAEQLAGNSWTLKDSETLVRKVQNLEGDIQVRHLQALSDARKVLTAEQLQQAHADGSARNLEGLFQ